ncbi:hypothetical protein V496_09848, partial [Pseudogymnoascus sp. VKM F-4515 (FW-2607)]
CTRYTGIPYRPLVIVYIQIPGILHRAKNARYLPRCSGG